jgi:DNA-binding Lrp family transcriptional regulator
MMNEAFKIDRLDLRILAQLQKNGRMTNVDLADAVGLSPSPCLIRVKRLEQAGYIAGYGAHLRLEKLGDTLTVFTEVTLSDHRREDFARFEAALREVDEVLECHLVSGGYDYLLRFLTRASPSTSATSSSSRPSSKRTAPSNACFRTSADALMRRCTDS